MLYNKFKFRKNGSEVAKYKFITQKEKRNIYYSSLMNYFKKKSIRNICKNCSNNRANNANYSFTKDI